MIAIQIRKTKRNHIFSFFVGMRIYGKNYEPGEIENRSAGPPADGAKGNKRRGRTTCST